MLILGLDVGDTNLSFVHGIGDEMVFNVPRSLACMPIVGHLGPLLVLPDVDRATLDGRHDKGRYLTHK